MIYTLLSNPYVLWGLGAVALLIAYQKLAPRLSIRVPGISITPEDLLAKILGPRYAQAKLQRVIDKLKKDGDYLSAGRLLEESERLSEAVDVYTEGQQFIAAAGILEQAGKHERAGELYLQAGDYKKAAQVFAQAGKHARAADLFKEKGNNLDAARLYGQAGQWDKAAVLYAKSGYPGRAAEAYEKCGEPLKAAEAYERHFMENVSYGTTYSATAASPDQKSALHAGRLYAKAGEAKRAIEIFQRGSYFKEAAEACLEQGQFAKAAELFMRAEEPGQAADAYEKGGDAVQAANLRGEVAFKASKPAEAAAFFQQGRDYLRAAELFESAGMLAEAAGAYEAGDSFAAAGNVYMRAGLKEPAAAAYERGGDFETAAKLYEEAGNTVKAVELFDRAGFTFKSGEAAAKAGDHDQAIALLQRVPPGDENYAAATEALADVFIKIGRPALALERLQKVLTGQTICGNNLNLFYWLAAAQEAAGKTAEALALYKKIQAEDLRFRDVEKRVTRLQTGTPPPTSVAPELEEVNRIGKYTVGPKIGQGAMGEVFCAHDPTLKRDVAIKMISATLAPESDLRARFEREAQSAARLNHPSIVTIYEFGQERGRIYMAMELLDGSDLRTVINRGSLKTFDQKLKVMEQICDGLAYAHSHEVVHRDLKPGNIHVMQSGNAKILDFGLARLGASELTQSGVILGTPNYMSPEQVRGERADTRSDVFSLGAVFYELLSGRRAFDAESMQGVLYHVLHDEPESVRNWVPDVPEAVVAVVERALAKDPNDRFKNAGEMREALRPVRRAMPASVITTAAAAMPAPRPGPIPESASATAPTAAPPPRAPSPAVQPSAPAPVPRAPAPPNPPPVAEAPPAPAAIGGPGAPLMSPPAPPSEPTVVDPSAPMMRPPHVAPAPAASAPSPKPNPPATVVGPTQAPTPAPAGRGARFIPQAEIGRGPKGIIHRGGDSSDGNSVALRFLNPDVLRLQGAFAALGADLKAAAPIVHPNLVKLIGFLEIGGKRCVVSELVPGKSFAEPLRAGKRVPFAHALGLARVLAETLALIHTRGLVHGGVQPANLMAAGGLVKLNDLGLGRVFQQVSGARQYWAPEGRFEAATDLYAMAATLYHLLTGTNPRGLPALKPASALTPGIPSAFDALLLRALDPKPENRFPSAKAVLEALGSMGRTTPA